MSVRHARHAQIMNVSAMFSTLSNRADTIMRHYFSRNMEKEIKLDGTPLTQADKEINQLVLETFEKHFPEIKVLAEEGDNSVDSSDYVVVCDPIDGTIPFSRGLPIATFCISLLHQGRPVLALVHNPFTDRTWRAQEGMGTWTETGKMLRMESNHNTIRDSNLSLIWWKGADYNLGAVAEELMQRDCIWMNPCSVAIMGGLIASGEFDGSIFPGRKSHETPAMELLVREAGGKATDIFGNELVYGPGMQTNGHIISNGFIHDELIEIVQKCNVR